MTRITTDEGHIEMWRMGIMDWMESSEVEEKEYKRIIMMKTMMRRKVIITMMQNTKSMRCTTRKMIKIHPLLNNQA
jgi:hypothetical protein